MLKTLSSEVKAVCIQTGNLLNINELMIKVGQTPAEELIESLKLVLKDSATPNDYDGSCLKITPRNAKNEQLNSFDVEDKNELKINVKVFLTSADKVALIDAVNCALSTLETDSIDSLVLACASSEGMKSEKDLPCLKAVWQVLEDLVESKKVSSIGVSDIDTQLFISLYNWAKVKPSIVQINLATCCVVPPALQEFTKQNDVQLLTHSDPPDMLPAESLNQVLGKDTPMELLWIFRYQVHVKCRGVLASKGYVVKCQHTS